MAGADQPAPGIGAPAGCVAAGQKPLDMRAEERFKLWFGSWLGRLAGTGKLILGLETGSPFVANLRLQWMDWLRPDGNEPPPVEVVQLLGDIDDVVSDEDNKDLLANASRRAAWLRVRGTSHGGILDLPDESERQRRARGTTPLSEDEKLRLYRLDKIMLAATASFDDVRKQNEELPLGTDLDVTHVVFVVHGIRDLGEWASRFETELRATPPPPAGTRAVVSIRYGYFGMGPFLLVGDRQKYVRWFMDEYTETRARYPNARRVDFVGHSNGTYLLGSALEHYESLRVDRVVLAGSVLRRDYDWPKIFARGQVKEVRNYVASDDWVVALFPTLFEQRPLRWFGNDLGSAGFNGFSRTTANGKPLSVTNVEFISGQHSAFLSRVGTIVQFVTKEQPGVDPGPFTTRAGLWGVLKFVSDYLCWAVWLLLASLVLFIALRVTASATQPAWPLLAVYILVVVFLLRRI